MECNMKNYEEEVRNFKFSLPEYINFGFDIVDMWAKDRTKLALVWSNISGKTIKKYSFWDISKLSNKFANVLLSLGIKKSDKIFIMIPNIPEWHIILTAANKIGAIVVPNPNMLSVNDIRYRLKRSEAIMAIMSVANANKLEEACSNNICPNLRYKMIINGFLEEWITYEEEMEKASDTINKDNIEPSKITDSMLVYFTSGTTRYPKMIVHDYSYAFAHIITAKYWHDLKPTDLHWTISDAGWAKTVWGSLYGQWIMGTSVFMHEMGTSFDAKITLKLLTNEGITSFCAIPTVYKILLKEDLSKYNFSSLRHCTSAGEPLNAEVIKKWKNSTGKIIYDGYGQTESIVLIANFPCMPVKYGSIGKPLPGFKIDLINDQGEIVNVNEVGNIAIRIKPDYPPGLTKNYITDDDIIENKILDNYFITGDKAYIDSDGYFWFYGRMDDMIKSSGYRISPLEIENVLDEHYAISESCVVGSPDLIRENIVKAFIVLKNEYKPSDELIKNIQNFVKKNIATYKYPREIEFVDKLPKTTNGKVKRAFLKNMEIEKKLGKK